MADSRNKNEQRREENGITYFDRGVITGGDGKRYQRFAIQTHFVQVGESQKDLVEKYVRPLYREGDVLSFGAKVMCMKSHGTQPSLCTRPDYYTMPPIKKQRFYHVLQKTFGNPYRRPDRLLTLRLDKAAVPPVFLLVCLLLFHWMRIYTGYSDRV